MRRAALLLALALPAAGVAGAAGPTGPPPGRYQASLCVATSPAAAPNCGDALLEIGADARLRVSVADIVYRLHLRPRQLDVATMHGAVQIDAFSAAYAWSDGVLRFVDADKAVRYEVRSGERLGAR